jgi:hypothetical protein
MRNSRAPSSAGGSDFSDLTPDFWCLTSTATPKLPVPTLRMISYLQCSEMWTSKQI